MLQPPYTLAPNSPLKSCVMQSITERAAAVLGNLSASEQFTGAIRECGGIPRLVKLLDSGARAKVTEIAAKSLANMAGSEHNRKSIQLAGGRPALVHLLLQGPSSQVCCLGLGCMSGEGGGVRGCNTWGWLWCFCKQRGAFFLDKDCMEKQDLLMVLPSAHLAA